MMSTRETARSPEQLTELFIQRANAGDVEGLVALYEPEAMLAAGKPVAQGHEEIRAFFRNLLEKKSDFPRPEIMPPLINGDTALTVALQGNGNISTEIARRQPDGSWRWLVDQLKIKPLSKD